MLLNRATKVLLIYPVLCGIIIPGIAGFAIERYFESLHGVVVSAKSDFWYAPAPENALHNLSTKPDLNRARISFYVWERHSPGDYFIVKGVGRRQLFIDGAEMEELRRVPYGIQNDPMPAGFHHVELICQPSAFADETVFQWTTDFIQSLPIPLDLIYRKDVGAVTRWVDLCGNWLLILSKLNFAISIVLCAYFGLKQLLRHVGLLPQHSKRMSWGLAGLFVLILCVRIAGIQYQVREGLHPDERMVQNSVMVFRTGDLQPRQYFWSSGFEYLAAAVENLGLWITGAELPTHLAARALSACFSWLSCLTLLSIGRKLFDESTAIWAVIILGFTLMPVEIAHQGIVESSMVSLFLLAFRFLLELSAETGIYGFAVTGVLAGLAIGIKQTAGLIVIPALIQFIFILRSGRFRWIAGKVLMWGAGCVIGYFILSPYALLDFHHFLAAQKWQVRSQEGRAGSGLFFAGEHSKAAAHILPFLYLADGMGYPILVAAGLGCVIVVLKSPRNAWPILPITFTYALVCAMSATPPYHYVLLLCPLIALLASIALHGIPFRMPHRSVAIAILGMAILMPSLYQTFLLERTLRGKDQRSLMEEWCNKNLLPGSRVDYELFGPRFLMPFLNHYRISLFQRDAWNQYLIEGQPEYYVFDSITAKIFDQNPDSLEGKWFRSLKTSSRIVQEFHGNPYRMYNPDLILYEIGGKRIDQ